MVRPVQKYPTPAIRFTLGVGAREFRDSDDVLRILPFVVRHAQRRAHSKSADATGLRIPMSELSYGSERNVKRSQTTRKAPPINPFRYRKRGVMSIRSISCIIPISSHEQKYKSIFAFFFLFTMTY